MTNGRDGLQLNVGLQGRGGSKVTPTEYWVFQARQTDLDPDQVASQNYRLPVAVHQEIRVQQLSFLEALLASKPKLPKVLDLGCGPGVWAASLAHRVEKWVGYDISPDFVRHAQVLAAKNGHRHLQFEVGSLLRLPPPQEFDVVVLGGTLGYLEDGDLEPLMDQVRRRLNSDGLVYVRVSCIPWFYPAIKSWWGYPIRYRKQADYQRVFEQSGFEVSVERDFAFTDSLLATAYTFLARWWGRTGMTAYRVARSWQPVCFEGVRWLLDFTPLPWSIQYVLRPKNCR